MWWVIGGIALILILIVIFSGGRKRLIAKIKLTVTNDGYDYKYEVNDTKHLGIAVVSYFTKIRWLLESEGDIYVERMQHLLNEYLSGWEKDKCYMFTAINSSPYKTQHEYTIEAYYIPGRNPMAYVINQLPSSCDAIDMTNSAFALLSETIRVLDDDEAKELLWATLKKNSQILNIDHIGESLSVLKKMYSATSIYTKYLY